MQLAPSDWEEKVQAMLAKQVEQAVSGLTKQNQQLQKQVGELRIELRDQKRQHDEQIAVEVEKRRKLTEKSESFQKGQHVLWGEVQMLHTAVSQQRARIKTSGASENTEDVCCVPPFVKGQNLVRPTFHQMTALVQAFGELSADPVDRDGKVVVSTVVSLLRLSKRPSARSGAQGMSDYDAFYQCRLDINIWDLVKDVDNEVQCASFWKLYCYLVNTGDRLHPNPKDILGRPDDKRLIAHSNAMIREPEIRRHFRAHIPEERHMVDTHGDTGITPRLGKQCAISTGGGSGGSGGESPPPTPSVPVRCKVPVGGAKVKSIVVHNSARDKKRHTDAVLNSLELGPSLREPTLKEQDVLQSELLYLIEHEKRADEVFGAVSDLAKQAITQTVDQFDKGQHSINVQLMPMPGFWKLYDSFQVNVLRPERKAAARAARQAAAAAAAPLGVAAATAGSKKKRSGASASANVSVEAEEAAHPELPKSGPTPQRRPVAVAAPPTTSPVLDFGPSAMAAYAATGGGNSNTPSLMSVLMAHRGTEAPGRPLYEPNPQPSFLPTRRK